MFNECTALIQYNSFSVMCWCRQNIVDVPVLWCYPLLTGELSVYSICLVLLLMLGCAHRRPEGGGLPVLISAAIPLFWVLDEWNECSLSLPTKPTPLQQFISHSPKCVERYFTVTVVRLHVGGELGSDRTAHIFRRARAILSSTGCALC